MSEILVVGSLAYDSITTPSGTAERALGGSANYFSLSASLFAKVRVVGVVGEDYDQKDYELLNSRGVDLAGLSKVPGKTFHWAGSYEGDMNEAKTLKTDLNVFEHFNPQLPEHFRDSSFVFLANIAPELQLQVLEQVRSPQFVGMDSMNLWLTIKKEKVIEVLRKVDLVMINEAEAKMLTGAANAISAAPMITAMGPSTVVIKRGEYGFAMYTREAGYFILPAMPIPVVVDPTGAGDTFAGGFFGYLAAQKEKPSVAHLKQACIMGSIMASHTIQDFSVHALAKVTLGHVETRMAEYRKVTSL